MSITTTQLDTFCAKLQTMVIDDFTKNYPGSTVPDISYTMGKKFAKIIRTDGSHRSVWGFVAVTDVKNKNLTAKAGDIMKAASWAAPAKHARGSILNADQLQGCGVFGPVYLK
jgi:hypothetical protein